MAPLFVALSIFIKDLPLVYPGRGLMVVRRRRRKEDGGVHAVTFSVLKKAYCCPIPEVLVLKAENSSGRADLLRKEELMARSVTAPIGDAEHGVSLMVEPQKVAS